MLKLDATLMAPTVSQVMSVTGWGLPPVDWGKRANQSAKNTLDNCEDAELFAPQDLASEPMAGAVRALLYLWTGWPGDCQMLSGAAPEDERLYISALAYRHEGKAEESKSQFQQLTDRRPHDVKLAKLATELISDNAEPSLKRFRDLIALGEAWETFAFTDLLAQAKEGKLNLAGEEIARKLQWEEFNLLLHSCYLAATGEDIEVKEQQVKVDKTPAWRKNQSSSSSRMRADRSQRTDSSRAAASATKPSDTKVSKSQPTEIKIKCPKCKHVSSVSTSSRGQAIKCGGCGVGIRVAGGDDNPTSNHPANSIKLACPKCRNVGSYAASARGGQVACSKCRTTFLFAAA